MHGEGLDDWSMSSADEADRRGSGTTDTSDGATENIFDHYLGTVLFANACARCIGQPRSVGKQLCVCSRSTLTVNIILKCPFSSFSFPFSFF